MLWLRMITATDERHEKQKSVELASSSCDCMYRPGRENNAPDALTRASSFVRTRIRATLA